VSIGLSERISYYWLGAVLLQNGNWGCARPVLFFRKRPKRLQAGRGFFSPGPGTTILHTSKSSRSRHSLILLPICRCSRKIFRPLRESSGRPRGHMRAQPSGTVVWLLSCSVVVRALGGPTIRFLFSDASYRRKTSRERSRTGLKPSGTFFALA
jgi:hypothetical protein